MGPLLGALLFLALGDRIILVGAAAALFFLLAMAIVARLVLRRAGMVVVGDVGGAGVYLLSDLSAGVTGEVVYVDGGWTAW